MVHHNRYCSHSWFCTYTILRVLWDVRVAIIEHTLSIFVQCIALAVLAGLRFPL